MSFDKRMISCCIRTADDTKTEPNENNARLIKPLSLIIHLNSMPPMPLTCTEISQTFYTLHGWERELNYKNRRFSPSVVKQLPLHLPATSTL